MKKSLLFLLTLLFAATTFGQLTGTKTIPGDYATISAAVTALNASGTTAPGVTFNVAAGHTETSVNITITTTTGSATAPIVFQKSGTGSNPLITAAAGTSTSVDGIIKIQGTDYVTFDGIDITDPVGNATATTRMEWGYAVLMTSATDASQNIIIKNSTITLQKVYTVSPYSRGIYSNTHTASSTTSITPTNATGVIKNCQVDNCSITNVYYGIYWYGSSTASYYGQDNYFGVTTGNNITNFGGSSATVYAFAAYYQNNLKIANNTVNGGTGTTTTMYGIYTGTGTNSNVDIYGNTVTLQSSATTSTIYAINNAMGGTGTSNTVNIYNNTVENCTYSTATSGVWYLCYQSTSPFTVNMYGNIVRNNSKPGTGSAYLLYNSNTGASGTINLYNNQVYSNTNTGSGSLYCIYSNEVSTTNKSIYGNTAYTNASTGGTVYGLYSATGNASNIYKNRIYDLSSSGTGGIVHGIYISTGTTVNVYNSYISDLRTPDATGTNAINGIYFASGTTVSAFYNTIYLNGSSTSVSTFGTSGIYASTTPTVELRNNIVINQSTPVGTAVSTAYRRSTTVSGNPTYAATSNNNNFYAGTPGASRLIYCELTAAPYGNPCQTMTEYKALMGPAREASSFTENPPFTNVATTPYDLHLQTTIATQCESGGSTVSTPSITVDYDNNARYPNTGYPDNPSYPATAPDVGADEFAGIPQDMTPPNISYTQLSNLCTAAPQILTATITDASGVPTSGTGLPMLYYRINAGSWVGVQGVSIGSNQYTFTFNPSLVSLDVVSYYVVAQDMSGTPNVGANPSTGAGGFTASPPAAGTPPTTPNTYTLYPTLSGTKTVGTGGDYATIEAAISALNNACLGAGGVTFNVAAGHTETFSSPTAGTITTLYPGAATPVIFQKSGSGANPLITAGVGTGTTDGIIKFVGGDYITFDGINLLDPLTNTTTTTQMEWGYAILMNSATEASQNITIKNSVITLQKANTSSAGVYSQNHNATSTTAIVPTVTTGVVNNCTVDNCTISDVYAGIKFTGYAASSPYSLYGQNNWFGATTGNTISNFGGAGSTPYGIYAAYQNGLKVANNNINGGTGTTTTLYGIAIGTSTSSSGDIYNNTITLSASGTTSGLYGISNALGSTAASNTVNIYGNTVQNCTYTTATSAAFYGIYSSSTPATMNIYGNTVSGNVLPGTGTFYGIYNSGSSTNLNCYNNDVFNNQKTGASGTMYCTYATTSVISFHDNDIYNNTIPSTSGTSSATIYGFYDGSSPTVETFYNNNIYDLSVGGTTTSTSSAIYGIYTNTVSTSVKNWYLNQIYNFSITSTGGGATYGMYTLLGATVNLYQNRFYNFSASGTAGLSYGIYISSGTAVNTYNNYISDLKAPAATGANAISGIYVSGGTTVGLYYNTIYLNAGSTGGTFGSSGIYTSTSPTVDMRNNIIDNVSTPGATGFTVAYRRSSTTLTTYAATSNYNDFYSGTPGANNLIFYDGTNSDQTISAFQTRVSTRDASSFSENPPFTNVASTPYNLHIQTTVNTKCESGGVTVATPVAITTDYDINARYPNTGYPDNPTSPATAPDVGADEFAGLEGNPPTISYTALGHTQTTGNRTLSATITDASGVPQTGTGRPVLYWKINTGGTYTSATGTYISGNQFDFSFGAGAVVGDAVYYYIAAQDNLLNAGVSPSAGASGFSANPPACSTPPTNPSFYYIQAPMTGIYTIDNTQPTAGTNFNNFTDAINRLNFDGVGTGGVTFNVISGQTFAETPPIITDSGTVANPIVFQKSGVLANPVIQATGGTGTTDAGLTVSGGDYFTFNGIDITASGTALEYGYYIRNASATNGATYNTVKNTKVTLDRSNASSVGIMQSASPTVGGGYNPTSAAGANSYNKYYNITIENSHHGIYLYNDGGSNDVNCEIGTTGGGTTTIGAATADDIGGSGTVYGIFTWYQNGIKVFNTEVRNVTSTSGTVYGIRWSNNNGTCELYNNKVHDIRTTSTSTGSLVYGLRLWGLDYLAGAVTRVYNNVIYGLNHGITTASATKIVFGIELRGSAAAYDIYNNTVRMQLGAPASNTAFITTDPPVVNLANNIFANFSTTDATSKRYCIFNSTTITTSSNNLLYIASGTNNFVGYGASADQASLEKFAASISGAAPTDGLESSSGNADPNFTSATDLTFAGATPAALSGIPIAYITTDIIGTVRNATRPTIGAYETAQTQNDKCAPAITNVTITSGVSPTVSCTVNDKSNSTNNATIRLWYRLTGSGGAFTGLDADSKPVGSINGTYTWAGSIAALTGGSYDFYIAARDDQGAGLGIWINPIWTTAFSGFAAADPPNFVTNPDAASNVRIFRKLTGTLSGTVNVGTAETYTSLTNAGGIFEKINLSQITGNVTVNITSDLSGETGTFPLNETVEGGTGGYSITFSPNAATTRVISGDVANAMVRLDGADRIAVDGRFSGSGQYLRFRNTNTSNPTLSLINDATSNTIRNCYLEGANTGSTSGVVLLGTTTGTTGNDNNLFSNNVFRDRSDAAGIPYHTFYSSGTALKENSSNTFTNNEFLNFSNTGIYVGSTGNGTGWTMSGNSFYTTLSTPPSAAQNGIYFIPGSASGNTISGNYIGGQAVQCGGSAWQNSGSGAFYGIYVNGQADVSGNFIRNIQLTATGPGAFYGIQMNGNFTQNVFTNTVMEVGPTSTSTGTADVIGIYYFGVSGGTLPCTVYNNIVSLGHGVTNNNVYKGIDDYAYTGNNLFCYFNNVSIGGTGNGSSNTYAFVKRDAVNETHKNNIYCNTRTGGTGKHYAIGATNTSGTFVSNYNDFYNSGIPLGYWGSDQNTLTNWQTTTGQDANSLNVNPNYVSATDLHPVQPLLKNAGTAITGITTDFAGLTRGTPPDIGAYEMPLVVTNAATNITCSGATFNGTITAQNYSVASSFEYGPTTSYGSTIAATPTPVTGTTATAITASLSLTAGATYHYRAVGTVGSTAFNGSDQTFTVYPAFVVGSISASQTICYNTTPTQLTGVAPTGGNTPYTYQWQNSADNTTFADISGATSLNYSPGALTATTYYRLNQTSASSCGTLTTNTVTITVYPQFVVGSISADQTICYNITPAQLTGVAPTGGNTPYSYQWESSTNDITYADISGATSLNYSPGALTQTTYYRLKQTSSSSCGTLTTNKVTITVYGNFVAGSISAGQNICYNTAPATLIGVAPTGGNTPYTYQWQSSTDNTTFADISGATSLNYSPGALTQTTYYKLKQTSASGCGTVTTNTVTITVYPNFVVGSISADQTICYNTTPSTLIGVAPTGGNTPYTYQWQSSTDDATYADISGATSLNYSPGALTQTTYYKLKQSSASGCGTLPTNKVTITVYPQFVAGSISADQSICYNTIPSTLVGVAPTGGNTPYTYQWQSSTDDATYADISGANSLNYSPGALTQTTYYKLKQTSASSCGTVTTNKVTITVYPNFVVGSISASQSICYNTSPATLTGVAPTGGNTPYTYQWQSSPDNTTFTDISGATSLNYSPGALTQTTYYRQKQTSASSCGTGTTNTVTITVYPNFVVGSISADQSICYNTTPSTLIGVAPTGGNTPYTYQWQSSTDDATYADISGATSLNYSPGALTQTTYYKLKQTSASSCGTVTTNKVTITVYPNFVVGSISASQSICYNTSPATLTGIAPTGGNTPYTYQWQSSPDNTTFTDISGATSLNYSPGALTQTTYYKLKQTSASSCGTGTTNTVTITVYPNFVVGSISADQTICYNTTPSTLIGVAPTGGNTPYTYQWQSSTDDATYADISGATSLNYSPGALTQTTYYKLKQTSASSCGTLTTNKVTITVYPNFVVGSISASQSICYNTSPATLTGVAPTGGNTPYTYQWQSSPDNTTFTDISGATSLNYSPGALTQTTYYKLKQTSASSCGTVTTNTVTITVNPLPVPTISGLNPACPNVALNYTTESGMTGYTWTVSAGGTINSGGATNQVTVTWTSSGTQSISVNYTNGNGCTAATPTTQSITVKPIINPSLTGLTSICAGNSTGYSTDPGNSAYIWTVSSGGTITSGAGTASVTVQWTTAGSQTISVTYTDPNGCPVLPTTKAITVHALPVPTITGPTPICAGTSGNIYSTEAGMTGYTWSVSSGGTITAGSGTNQITVTWNTAGGQTVSVNYTNANSCTATSATIKAITVNALPVPAITGPASVCVNSTGNVYTTEAGMTGYLWTVSAGGTITAGAGTRQLTVTWNTAGPQTVSVNYTNTNGCTAASATVYGVTVNPLPVPTITGPTPVCYNSTGNLYTTESGMTNYAWTVSSGGAITSGGTSTNNTVTVTWNTAGAQSVSVNYVNGNGCMAASATVYNVNVYPQFSAGSISASQTICYNTIPALLTGTAPTGGNTPYTYQWQSSPNGTTWTDISGATALTYQPVALTATTYYRLNQTSASGCGTVTTNTVTITVYGNLIAGTIAASQNICYNTTPVQLTGTAPTGGNTPYTYQWQSSPNGTTWTDITGATALNYQPGTLTTTTYYQLNQTSASGCGTVTTNMVTITVTQTPVPTVTGNNGVCVNTSGNIYTTESGMNSYNWTISAGGTITAGAGTNQITVTWNTAGPQYLTVYYITPIGCTPLMPTIYPVTVFSRPSPTIAGSGTVCAGTTGVTYTTEAGQTGYSWSVSSGGTVTAGSGTNQITVTWNTAGPQTVSVNYSNLNGCAASAATVKNVTVNALPIPTIIGPTPVCAATSGNVYSTESGMTGYTWTVSAGGTITAGAGTNSITVTWTVAGAQTVSVNYANASGCTAASATVYNVTVNALPVPTITGPTPVCFNSTGNVYTTESGMTNYNWTVSSGGTITSGGTSTNNTVTITWNTAGAQTVAVNYVNGNGCTAASATVYNVSVYPQFVAGTISASQSICYNTIPAILTGTAPTGGNTPYTYQWQSSPNGTTWTDISGATALTYQPGALTATTYYRLNQTSASGCGTVTTNTVTITVYGDLTAGTITASQSICYNTIPALLTGTTPTGGNTPYTYQWQSSPDGTTWTDISGATALTYQPGALTATTYYRLNQTSASGCGTVPTNTVTITVYSDLTAGTIATSQSICYNTAPALLTGTAPTGGNTPYTYQWQSSPNGTTWTDISGATSLTYQPGALTATTYYRLNQTSSSGCGTVTTNTVTITVYPDFVAGSISASQSICYNTIPVLLTGTAPTGGNTPYTYQWQSSPNGTTWTDISGATTLTYQPGALTATTYYRLNQTSASGCGMVITNTVTITVYGNFVAGTISASQSICYNTVPAFLTGTAPTGGNTPYTYQWQSSPNGTTWTDISGATALTHQPGALTATTYYRLNQTSSSSCGTVTTNTVTITVYGNYVAGTIAASQSICYNTVPVLLTGTAPTGGNTPYTYQWQSSPNGTTWTDITGATTLTYQPGALTATTYYRINQTSSSGCGTLSTNTVTITVYPNYVVGSISASQTICYNTAPALLTGVAPTGGNTPYTYQWQNSPNGTTFTDIAGATGLNYQPPALTSTTYYRLNQSSASGCGTLTTNSVTITVYPNFVAGTIAASQSICYNTAPALLTGTAPTGGNTPYSYQWQNSPNGTTWTNIAGATGLTYQPPVLLTTTYYRLNQTSASGCGTLSTNMVTITVNPLPVPTVTGPASVCVNSTGNIYTTQAAMTGYLWTVSAGGTITAGAGTNAITVSWTTTGAKTVTVNYTNSNGCTATTPTVYNVTVNPLPVPTITGSNSLCVNSGNYTYSTETGMTNYLWTVSSGGSIVAGSGTNAITVTWNLPGAQTVSVNYTNSSGCTAPAATVLNVTVNPLPGAAGIINGNTNVCAGTNGVAYSTAPIPNTTFYVWSVPPGATIATGAGTTAITVNYSAGATNGFVTVYGNNLCGNGTPYSLPVTVTQVPAAAGPITGPTTACQGSTGNIYTVPVIANATGYVWTLPPGGTITAGANTNSITVSYAATASSGTVTVHGTNTCGSGASSSLNVTIVGLPGPAGPITGPTSVCWATLNVVYSVTPILNATGYIWTLPPGAWIQSGGNTNSITVGFSIAAKSGLMTVKGTNTCGEGTPSSIFITITSKPPTPFAIYLEDSPGQAGDTLVSSAPEGNQWYRDGFMLEGEILPYMVPAESGEYYVIVCLSGCCSDESNHVFVGALGITDPDQYRFNVYPVPNDGQFTASIEWPKDELFTIVVYNTLGAQIYQTKVIVDHGKVDKFIDIRPAPNGVYSVVFFNSDYSVIKKIVINK